MYAKALLPNFSWTLYQKRLTEVEKKARKEGRWEGRWKGGKEGGGKDSEGGWEWCYVCSLPHTLTVPSSPPDKNWLSPFLIHTQCT